MSVAPLHDDLGQLAHQAAEKHLEACWEALDAESEGEVVDWPETIAPFCGCLTCQVRETLSAAWPLLIRAAQAEVNEQHGQAP